MKLSGNYNVGGEVAKEDERYKVVDNTLLKGLVLSSTDLNPGHSTSGHKHAGQEEVYMFINGKGSMTLSYPDGKISEFSVSSGALPSKKFVCSTPPSISTIHGRGCSLIWNNFSIPN